jgi:hypothetical protein
MAADEQVDTLGGTTVVVRTSGGSFLAMDVPVGGTHARERFDGQVAKGDLAVVPDDYVELVTDPDGTSRLVPVTPEPDAPAKGKSKG